MNEKKYISKKKVLFFLPSTIGGAERMTITIAKMLPRDLFDVKFVIVHKSLGDITAFIPNEYEIIHIPIHNIYCATTLRMMKIIHKERADIVFCSLLYMNARLIIAAKLCGIKVIVRNNIELSKCTSWLSPMLVKLTYRWADMIIAQQEEMRNELIKLPKVNQNKVVVMHNPLDYDTINKKSTASSPYSNDDKQIKYACVGRFGYEKGQDLLVKAFELVRAQKENVQLYIIGKYDWDKTFDNSIKEYVNEHNLTDYVHFIGFDNNPYRWVKYCDCYVMPSRQEGLPNALIEAMYLGRPVAATMCIPIIQRIVKNGYNGYLAESENIDSIASCMIKALELKNFEMTYQPASKEAFIRIFMYI